MRLSRACAESRAVCHFFVLYRSRQYLKPAFAFRGPVCPKTCVPLNYRAKELNLKLPLLQSILPSNEERLERAVDMILSTGKRNIVCWDSA